MPRIDDVYQSKYFNAATLKGQTRTFTITGAVEDMVGQGDDAKNQIVLSFDENEKPFGLNKTNARAIANLFGADTDDWIGEQIVLFPTRVSFNQAMVDAVRVDEPRSREILQNKLKAMKAGKANAGPTKAAPGKVAPMTQKEVTAELDSSEDIEVPF